MPNLAGIDVSVDKLTGYGNTVNTLGIKGSGRNGLLSVRFASRELNGDVIWQPQGNGKLLGRFKNVMLGEGHGDPGLVVGRGLQARCTCAGGVSAAPAGVDNSAGPVPGGTD